MNKIRHSITHDGFADWLAAAPAAWRKVFSEFNASLFSSVEWGRFLDVNNPFLVIPFATLLLASILAAGLNLYILGARLHTATREKRWEKLYDIWGFRFFEVLYQDLPDRFLLDRVNKKDLEVFARFLEDYLDIFKGNNWYKVVRLYRRAGLATHELYQLEHAPLKWRRALAANRLGKVKAQEALPALMKCVQDSDNALMYNAATAIMAIGDPPSIKQTLTLLLNHEGLSEELFSEIVLGYGKSINVEFMEMMMLYNGLPRSRLRIIDFLGYFGNPEAAPVLLELLRTSCDSEERIRLVKALGHIAPQKAVPLLRECLRDENAVIRSQAAKALGNFEEADNITHLAPLLEDRDWWCRNHSANAILKSGKAGQDFLKATLSATRDPFTRDMIHQTLEKTP